MDLFTGVMAGTWAAATLAAVVAGAVGFFVVLRGWSFAAHAVPHGSFGGAAGAALLVGAGGTVLGVDGTIAGLAVFAVAGALAIGLLGRRVRQDVATALSLVLMLGLGALFLSWSSGYAQAAYSLLFGEVFGVPAGDLLAMAALGAACLVALATLFRPLLLSSVLPEVGEARGVRARGVDIAFLLVIALATTMSVPVVGVLLMFSLMIGPAAAAHRFAGDPRSALLISVALALVTVWVGIAVSYASGWPLGFFVGISGVLLYAAGTAWSGWRRRRRPLGPPLRA